MSVFFEFEEVDSFTSGAIGQPGQRVFYLQARSGDRLVTVRCEKQQVAAIANYLARVMVDLPPPEDRTLGGPGELQQPVDAVFVLGPIGLGYDRSSDRIVVQLEEMLPNTPDQAGFGPGDPDSDDPDRGQIRVYVKRSQAAAFCDRAEQVVAAGRPNCQWCDLPIDPDGHPCPRMN
jgi:uncharacterized repeat protein (TIGR03847 family)